MLLELSNELLIQIISNLNLNDIFACSLTCKPIRDLIGSDYFWKTAYQTKFPTLFAKTLTNKEVNWREEYIDAAHPYEPNLDLVLAYLNYYKIITNRTNRNKSVISLRFSTTFINQFSLNKPSYSDNLYTEVIDAIYMRPHISWGNLILKIRENAKKCQDFIYSNRSLLVQFLEGIASYIIASLQDNKEWEKYLASLRQELNETSRHIYNYNSDYDFHTLNPEMVEKEEELIYKLVLLGDTSLYHQAVRKKLPVPALERLDSKYYLEVYKEHIRPITKLWVFDHEILFDPRKEIEGIYDNSMPHTPKR